MCLREREREIGFFLVLTRKINACLCYISCLNSFRLVINDDVAGGGGKKESKYG